MKIILIIFVSLFSFSIVADDNALSSGIPKEKSICAVENYKLCLNHENDGVVESTLTNIIKFKYRFPEAKIDCFFKCLEKLSKNSKQDKIRKKAQLVSKILKNEDLLTEIGDNFYSEVDQLIEVILLSSRLEQFVLTGISN